MTAIELLTKEKLDLESNIKLATIRLTQIDKAIEILGGSNSIIKLSTDNRLAHGKPMHEYFMQAALAYASDKIEVFDYKALVAKCIELNPTMDQNIFRKSVYTATTQLRKLGKLRLCANGLCLINPPQVLTA